MCNPPVNQHSYTGTMNKDLVSVVCGPNDNTDVWEVLTHARRHICAHEMTAGDVQAWYLMADLQEQIVHEELVRLQVMKPRHKQCQASEGVDATQCGHAAILGTEFCAAHTEE